MQEINASELDFISMEKARQACHISIAKVSLPATFLYITQFLFVGLVSPFYSESPFQFYCFLSLLLVSVELFLVV